MGFFDSLDDLTTATGKIADLAGNVSEIVGSVKGGGSGGTTYPNVFLPPNFRPDAAPAAAAASGGGFNGNTLLIVGAVAVGALVLWRVLRR